MKDTVSEHKRLVAYSLLAALSEETGQEGLDYVFIPLVKKGLIAISNRGMTKGASILEMRDELKNIFDLEFPLPYLKKLITVISSQFENEYGGQIILHRDESFQFEATLSVKLNDKVVSSFEKKVIDEANKVELIETLFRKFIESNEVKEIAHVTLIDFIELNKIALSNYFSEANNSDTKISELKFNKTELNIIAKFFLEIKKDELLFNILKKLYLGSVYASYLTIDTEQSNINLELVLDTSFLLGLLNLKSIETNDTCHKIYEVSKKLGLKLTVLKITIEETQDLLNRLVDVFSTDIFERQINPESILAACDRNGLTKNDLARISAKIEKTLVDDFNINLIHNDDYYRRLAKTKYRSLFDFLRRKKPTDFNALHDTVGEAYVIEKRGRPVHSFLGSKIWFVKGSALNIYKPTRQSGLPPFITTSVLVNILWLTSPITRKSLSGEDVSKIGITKLISSTLDGSLPPMSVLKNFDKNLVRMADKKIDVTDCVVVASMVAEREIIKDISQTIESNILQPEIINEKIKKYSNEATRKEKIWRDAAKEEIRRYIEKTTHEFITEKTELQTQMQTIEIQNVKLQQEQSLFVQKENQLRQHILTTKVNKHFQKWQNMAFISLILLILAIGFIVLSFFFQEKDWNFISTFYDWVDGEESTKKELIIAICINLFFTTFGTFCLKGIWDRWFSKKEKKKKRQELIDDFKEEVSNIGEQLNTIVEQTM